MKRFVLPVVLAPDEPLRARRDLLAQTIVEEGRAMARGDMPVPVPPEYKLEADRTREQRLADLVLILADLDKELGIES
jgi:hypothetical protein